MLELGCFLEGCGRATLTAPFLACRQAAADSSNDVATTSSDPGEGSSRQDDAEKHRQPSTSHPAAGQGGAVALGAADLHSGKSRSGTEAGLSKGDAEDDMFQMDEVTPHLQSV